mmetsp:Transcript_27425/g.88049  ORF Transcript_27425/g.88049 Transcript_27425/m.88049 type:complete len:274 (+) Transcript_27425:477-1298(+)
MSVGCRKYLEFVADIHKRGAAVHLPTEGPAAAISRLGLLPVQYGCGCCTTPSFWGGDDSHLNSDPESQVRDCFSAADAMRLETACYSWLYDNAPHVMACLDVTDPQAVRALWRMPDGAPAADPSRTAEWVWRWRVEQRPPREDVLRLGVLTPARRGVLELHSPPCLRRGGFDLVCRASRGLRRCDECMHLFGAVCERPSWAQQCDACDALHECAVRKRQRCDDRCDDRCDECVRLFGMDERPGWSQCNMCDGRWPLWDRTRGELCVSACVSKS